MSVGTDDEHDDYGEYDDEGPATIACQHCGEEVYEDAPQCPSCLSYDFGARRVGQDGPLFKVLLFLSIVIALAFAFT